MRTGRKNGGKDNAELKASYRISGKTTLSFGIGIAADTFADSYSVSDTVWADPVP